MRPSRVKHTAMTLARMLRKMATTRHSTGYTHPPVMKSEDEWWFKATTPEGRRFKITVKEISVEEELRETLHPFVLEGTSEKII